MQQGLVEFNAAFVIQIINALLLFGVLTFILFKPVTKFLNKRTENIQSSIDEAEVKLSEADKLRAEYEKQLRDIKNERNAIIGKATETRLQIEGDKQRMLEEVKAEVSSLVIAVASKVIEKELDEASHRNMIQNFIDEVGDVQWEN